MNRMRVVLCAIAHVLCERKSKMRTNPGTVKSER